MNSESKDYFLSTKEAKRATKEFKKLINEMGLQLRIKSENENNRNYMINHYELTFVMAKKYVRHGSTFHISTNSKNIITLKTWTRFPNELMKDIIYYVLELGKIVGANALVFKVEGEHKDLVADIKDLKTLSRKNGLDIGYIHSKSKCDEFVYVNIKKEFVENQLKLYYTVNNFLEARKAQDITFKANITRDDKGIRMYSYYINGLKGDFTINLYDEIIVKDKYFNETVHINHPNDISAALTELFERVGNETKFPSLIEPPKHHFRTYLGGRFYSNEKLISGAFNLLMDHLEPQEIEVSFATSPDEVYKELFKKESTLLAEIHSMYFVVDFDKGDIEKYTDLEKASPKYEAIITAKLYNKHMKEVNKLKEDLKNLTVRQ